jgi:leader peptidase (prepilin peptidase) / N-methyltransferase
VEWVGLAIVAGALVGALVRWRVRRHTHRRADESPSSTLAVWWLIPLVAAGWGWLTWRLMDAPWPILTLWLPLSAALAWLAAVDLDVARLPDRILVPAAIWAALGVGVTMWITGPLASVGAILAAALCGGSFWILHLAGRGALGFGDVKLAAVIGAATALVSWTAVLYALVAGCVLALAWAAARRRRELAFGPWLALGAVLAVGLAR